MSTPVSMSTKFGALQLGTINVLAQMHAHTNTHYTIETSYECNFDPIHDYVVA